MISTAETIILAYTKAETPYFFELIYLTIWDKNINSLILFWFLSLYFFFRLLRWFENRIYQFFYLGIFFKKKMISWSGSWFFFLSFCLHFEGTKKDLLIWILFFLILWYLIQYFVDPLICNKEKIWSHDLNF